MLFKNIDGRYEMTISATMLDTDTNHIEAISAEDAFKYIMRANQTGVEIKHSRTSVTACAVCDVIDDVLPEHVTRYDAPSLVKRQIDLLASAYLDCCIIFHEVPSTHWYKIMLKYMP